jgi:farnesyl diphosphate synthase
VKEGLMNDESDQQRLAPGATTAACPSLFETQRLRRTVWRSIFICAMEPPSATSPPSKRTKSDDAVAPGGKMTRDEFLSHFPQLAKLIVDEVKAFGMPAFIMDYLVRVLDYNVPGGKLTRGMAVPSCLQAIVGASLTDDARKQAIVVGWCIELLQASFLVADDMMDKSETRRGQPCWYKVPDVEHKAINDTLILESGIYLLLRHFCGSHARYMDIVHLFQRVALQTQMGQCLDLTMEQSQQAGVNLSLYSHEHYVKTVVYKTAYYSFYLSVAAGMMLADVKDAGAFKDAEEICVDMGTYFQVQDDYLDCFAPPEVLGKIGTDIKDAKCCWLVIQVIKFTPISPKSSLLLLLPSPQASHSPPPLLPSTTSPTRSCLIASPRPPTSLNFPAIPQALQLVTPAQRQILQGEMLFVAAGFTVLCPALPCICIRWHFAFRAMFFFSS